MKNIVSTSGAPSAIGPYSQAVNVGNMIFTSGQIAPKEPTVAAQAEKIFDSLTAILNEAGFELSDIVKTTVFLTDMADFAELNEVYGKRMPAPYPGRSCVAVAALPAGAKVEIEVVAVK